MFFGKPWMLWLIHCWKVKCFCFFFFLCSEFLCELIEIYTMDPGKPPNRNDMAGVPWLGCSRGLPLSTDIGRARGLVPPADNTQGPGEAQTTEHSVFGWARGLLRQPDYGGHGRARGFLFSASEPKVGVARGTTLPSLEPHRRLTPHGETMTQDLRETTPTPRQGSPLFSMLRGVLPQASTTPWGRGILTLGVYISQTNV